MQSVIKLKRHKVVLKLGDKMVKHIYIDLDDQQYIFLTKLKGGKDWKTFFMELASKVNPEGELLSDLLEIKRKATGYIDDKDKLNKLVKCLDQAIEILQEKAIEAKAN